MSDRHLEPTPQRKQRARAEGRFPRSRDLSGLAVLLASFCLLGVFRGDVMGDLRQLVNDQFSSLTVNLNHMEGGVENGALRLALGRWLPFAGLLLAVAIASQLGQGGPVWAPDRVLPRASRLWSRGGNAMPVGLALVAKFSIILGVTALFVRRQLFSLFTSGESALAPGYLGRSWTMAGLWLLGCGLVVAVVDYAWSIWRYHQSLRMTPEEMREEMRERGGGLRVPRTLPVNQEKA